MELNDEEKADILKTNMTAEQKIITMIPKLMKTCKKSLSSIRNPHIQKEMIYYMTMIMKEFDLIKNKDILSLF
jgi:hypothetical protein